METQVTQNSKSPHPLMWAAAIALIVFCAAGVGAVMGWIPTSMGKPDDAAALAKLEQDKAAASKTTIVKVVPGPTRVVVAAAPTAPTPVAAVRCTDCGVIQSVNEVAAKGAGSGLGAAGGAVVGGLLGSQVGHGDGTTIATVIGAVGGAVAGNEVEKRVKTTKSYEITVRFDDGTSRMFSLANEPSWRAGDKVRVVNGVIQSNA
jgi:outer membrane lipoprotein SlyB